MVVIKGCLYVIRVYEVFFTTQYAEHKQYTECCHLTLTQ